MYINYTSRSIIFVFGVQHSDLIFLQIKIHFKLVEKYWLYSLCSTMYPYSLFYTQQFVSLNPLAHLVPFLFPLPLSLFSVSVSQYSMVLTGTQPFYGQRSDRNPQPAQWKCSLLASLSPLSSGASHGCLDHRTIQYAKTCFFLDQKLLID